MTVPRRPPRAARSSAVFAPEYAAMLRALRAARKAAGLTLADVAQALRRPVSFVSKCELGERRVDPVDLWHFAHLYGRDMRDFLPAEPPTFPLPVRRARGEPGR